MQHRVLITGGAGFIGHHVIRQCLSAGCSVSVLDNFSTGRRETLAPFGPAVRIIEGDAADFDLAREVTAGLDSIIHLAAVPSVVVSTDKPWLNQHCGEVAGLAILHAAALNKVRRVVLASSAAVYGNPQSCPISESAPIAPISNYGVSKAALEMYGRCTSHNHPATDVVSLRFFNVYGPGQNPDSAYSGVISIFCRQAMAGQPVTIYGTGEQTRDFVYVEDVARACLLAATSENQFRGAAINIATGQPTTLNQLWSIISEICQTKTTPAYQPARPGEIVHSCAEISMRKALSGFTSTTNLSQGLRCVIKAGVC